MLHLFQAPLQEISKRTLVCNTISSRVCSGESFMETKSQNQPNLLQVVGFVACPFKSMHKLVSTKHSLLPIIDIDITTLHFTLCTEGTTTLKNGTPVLCAYDFFCNNNRHLYLKGLNRSVERSR